jgi:hypothetical protein
VIYELTFHFCRRFLSPRDRTVDQMIQAARSGKQNIIEGSVWDGNRSPGVHRVDSRNHGARSNCLAAS